MDVQTATSEDLATVLGWLEREYAEDDGEGFWCNRLIIARALEDGDLWVIRRDGEAVAFQVGDYAADIVSVRKEHRRQGLGDALFAASLDRAAENNVNVLSIECMPRSSWPFWRRHGFERYGDMSEWGKITARRVLTRSFDIPAGLPSADVAISFYPEAAIYSRDVPPISVHQVRAGRLDDGAIMLERRVIGLCGDEPEGKDLAIKIEIDGVLRCFGKRKQIKKSEPVRCWLDTANDPSEISLDENVTRTPMHPADQFERFQELSENKGWGAEEIGARFGVSAGVVKQRLRLGAVSPKLLQVYREDGLTLDQLMAFAITEDHDRQEQVFANLHHNREPWIIRRDMTAANVPADDRRAMFVGADAYVEAGGNIIRDLFSEDRGGFFEDAGLLDMLAAEKLREIAGEVQAEGWKWAEAHIDYPHAHGMRRFYPQSVPLSDEDEARLEALSAEYDELAEGYLSPDGADRMEAAFARRLDRLSRQVQRLERNTGLGTEALALFVRFWLLVTPPLPDEDQAAAQAKGRKRYEGFVETLGRRYASGKSLLDEIPEDIAPRPLPDSD